MIQTFISFAVLSAASEPPSIVPISDTSSIIPISVSRGFFPESTTEPRVEGTKSVLSAPELSTGSHPSPKHPSAIMPFSENNPSVNFLPQSKKGKEVAFRTTVTTPPPDNLGHSIHVGKNQNTYTDLSPIDPATPLAKTPMPNPLATPPSPHQIFSSEELELLRKYGLIGLTHPEIEKVEQAFNHTQKTHKRFSQLARYLLYAQWFCNIAAPVLGATYYFSPDLSSSKPLISGTVFLNVFGLTVLPLRYQCKKAASIRAALEEKFRTIYQKLLADYRFVNPQAPANTNTTLLTNNFMTEEV